MKKITTWYYLLLICFLVFSNQINAKRGYIVTRDAKIITGEVVGIFYSDDKSTLTFVNDLGNIYEIRAMLIWGFGFFNKDGKEEFYESKFQNNRWTFLKNIFRGKKLNLYQGANKKIQQETVFDGVYNETYSNEFWLQIGRAKPIRLYQFNYKRLLKKRFPQFKAITSKLGKKGYKFSNLLKIIKELDERHGKKV